MSWKDTNITNPGTSIKYGADDMEMVSRLFNGVTTGVAAVTIKSTNKWGFWDAILYFRNQADTKNITIRGPTNSPSTDIDLTLPPSTANDTLASIGLAQTFAQKQTFTSGAVFTQMSSPANPGSSKHHLFVASNGHLMKRDNAGLETDYNALVAGFVDMKDATIAARDLIRVFKVSTTYYAVNTTGAVISSGTNPATVIQAALDISPPIEVFINAEGSTGWDFQAGFTGLDCKSYNTIHLSGTSNLNVPSGYTGAMFKIAGVRTNITIYSDGGYVNEVATVSRNWIAVQIGAGDSSDNIDNINIRGLVTFTSGDVVKINQGSTGTIESILLDGLSTDDTRRFITWNVSDATKVKDVTVQNCRPLLDGGSVTDCFKDVKGTRTLFIANTLYGVQGSCNETNIASGAVNTMIFGGNHTGVTGAFTDLGTDTYISDVTHTEFKLRGTPVSATISADQNNWSPTGWNEKQNTIRVTASGAARTITGLVPGANPKNRIVRLLNVGTFDVVLSSENASSTAANRFKFQTNITMMANQSTTLFYDSTDSRWRALSDAMAGHAMTTMANTFLEPITIKKDASDLLFLYRPNSTTNINQDLDFDFNDSVGTQVTYCDLRATVLDGTDGSEDGRFQINIVNAGTKVRTHLFENTGELAMLNNTSTVGANTILTFQALDSGAAVQNYAQIRSEILDNTAASEDGKLLFYLTRAGATTAVMELQDSIILRAAAGQDEIIEMYNPINTVGESAGMNWGLKDSANADHVYGNIYCAIVTNTAGATDSRWSFWLKKAGTGRNVFKIDQNGAIEMFNGANSVGTNTELSFQALSSTNNTRTYARIRSEIITNTNAAEDGKLEFLCIDGGTLTENMILYDDGTLELLRGPLSVIRSGSNVLLGVYRTNNTVGNQAGMEFFLQDSGSAKQQYGSLMSEIVVNTNGSEKGKTVISNMDSGTLRATQTFWNDGYIDLFRASSTNFIEWGHGFKALDTGSNETYYGYNVMELIDSTNGSEDGQFDWDVIRAGTLQRVMKLEADGTLRLGLDTNNMRYVGSYISTRADHVNVINTGAETTIINFTVKGGIMDVDSHVIVKAHGYLTQNSATATNYALRIKVGGTTVYQDNFGGSHAQSATVKPWYMELRFYRSNQSSTTGRMVGFLAMQDTSAPTTGQGSITDDETLVNANIRAQGISWTFANDTAILVSIDMDQTQAASEFQLDGYTAEFAP